MPHLSDIASDCPLCGGREVFTGRTRHKEGRTYAVLRCSTCRSEGLTWRSAFEPALNAYWAARKKLQDPQRYDLAWVLLRDRDSETVRTALHLLHAGQMAEAPFFRLEDIRYPQTAEVARLWADVALTYPGFRPAPTPAQRIEEALAAALQFDAPSCAHAAARCLDRLASAGLDAVLQRLPARMGEAASAEALVPFFKAVAATPDGRKRLDAHRARWSIPALRQAARQEQA